jgi:hypothetical protein
VYSPHRRRSLFALQCRTHRPFSLASCAMTLPRGEALPSFPPLLRSTEHRPGALRFGKALWSAEGLGATEFLREVERRGFEIGAKSSQRDRLNEKRRFRHSATPSAAELPVLWRGRQWLVAHSRRNRMRGCRVRCCRQESSRARCQIRAARQDRRQGRSRILRRDLGIAVLGHRMSALVCEAAPPLKLARFEYTTRSRETGIGKS